MSVAPDYAQPIEGWRAWRVVTGRCGARLASIHYDGEWVPGEPLVARCQQRRRSLRHPFVGLPLDHGAPQVDCRCGVYAAATRTDAVSYATTLSLRACAVYAIGAVDLWGAVIEHSRGWRAAQAYPKRLYLESVGVAPERLRRIALELADYGVPVSVVDGPAAEPRCSRAAGVARSRLHG